MMDRSDSLLDDGMPEVSNLRSALPFGGKPYDPPTISPGVISNRGPKFASSMNICFMTWLFSARNRIQDRHAK